MSSLLSQTWLRGVILTGALYFGFGRLFAWPTTNVHAWRLAAWFVSGIVFAAHIAHERLKRRSPRATAFHVALGVALGAFLLAVAGMLNAAATRSSVQPTWFVALVAWPAFTAIPAFLVALLVASAHSRRESAHQQPAATVRPNEELKPTASRSSLVE